MFTLRDFEEIARGYVLLTLEWRDEECNIKTKSCFIHELIFLENRFLDAKILRIDLENKRVFLQLD